MGGEYYAKRHESDKKGQRLSDFTLCYIWSMKQEITSELTKQIKQLIDADTRWVGTEGGVLRRGHMPVDMRKVGLE